MKKSEFISQVRSILLQKYGKKTTSSKVEEYDEFSRHPQLKQVILTLLTDQYNLFLSSIDWVAPRPTMFRINLRNDKDFYLTWLDGSWVAQIEGKKYFLQNLPEEQRALEALSRLLKYGAKLEESDEETSPEESPLDDMANETETEETPEET